MNSKNKYGIEWHSTQKGYFVILNKMDNFDIEKASWIK